MNLKRYKAKRDFKQTPEPQGSEKDASGKLNFCIQKHDARRLHYDFRLEYKGVLLSWAVPKGPSLDPKDKRLAIQVEDHPLDYQYFEGIIPKGSYGAGTVEIWDHGYYTTHQSKDPNEIESYLQSGLKKGHFNVILHGTRLQGEWIFQKLNADPSDMNWLLIKKDDAGAMPTDMEDKQPIKKPVKPSKMPSFIKPMLANLVEKPFDDPDWLFEIKWDGFRALALINHGRVELKSRAENVLNDKFPSIVRELEKIGSQLILDGELVILDEKGRSSFQLMQNYQKNRLGALYYYVFDLLYLDGQNLKDKPLIERKEELKKIIAKANLPHIRFSDHIINDGKFVFKEAVARQLEGIMGKNISSSYQSRRSSDWVKIKTKERQEVVIGGFTAPRGSREKFGALLVGTYDVQGDLIYAGHVGGGFDAALLRDMHQKMEPLEQPKSPFKIPPKPNAPVTWIKPKLVCEVAFAEWTQDGIMRQPIFQGLRMDKSPKSVSKEAPIPIPIENKTKRQQTKAELTNLDKVYWPEEGYTKGDLLDYYKEIAAMILPYLKNRPIVLHRYPNGINGKEFYHKDIGFTHPDWIKTYPVSHDEKIDNYLLIEDLQSLLFAVNLGSIDLHPFISHCDNLDSPDFCAIDLDPHDIPFKNVVDVALELHEYLDKIKVKHHCKTSGGKGLHILIPLNNNYTFDQSRVFAEILCNYLHRKFPKTTSVERSPSKRPKKLYLDFLQNRSGQTIAAPYSARPRPHATVSTPLSWDEVNHKLDPKDFTIKTVPRRIKALKGKDLFTPLLKEKNDLEKALKAIKTLEDRK